MPIYAQALFARPTPNSSPPCPDPRRQSRSMVDAVNLEDCADQLDKVPNALSVYVTAILTTPGRIFPAVGLIFGISAPSFPTLLPRKPVR